MSRTPKAELEELFVKFKSDGPQLEWCLPTPLENGQFKSSCKFKRATDESLIEGVGVGQTIKNSQHEAAVDVLSQLEKLDSNFKMQSEGINSPSKKKRLPVDVENQVHWFRDGNSATRDPDSEYGDSDLKLCVRFSLAGDPNYVGKLQEYCLKNNLTLPVYSQAKVKLVHDVLTFATTCTTEGITKDGEASQKILSKKVAAYKVYKSLKSLELVSKEADDINASKPEVEANAGPSQVLTQPETKAVAIFGQISYYPESILGRGGFSKVFKGFKEVSSWEVAIKRVKREAAVDSKCKELEIFRETKHENIISYFDSAEVGKYFYYVMELANSNLPTWIKKQNDTQELNTGVLVKICKDIATGLNELHKGNIIHRDIKPENVLLFQKEPGTEPKAKLSDFGISRIINAGDNGIQTSKGDVGTITYMPPESKSDMTVTRSFDIFPLGIVLAYTMTGGQHIFCWPDETEDYQIQSKIKEDKPFWTLIEPPKYTGLKNLLKVMLQYDPHHRSNMEVLLEHPFFWDTKEAFSFVRGVSNDIKNCGLGKEEVKMVYNFPQPENWDWKQQLHQTIQDWIIENDKKIKDRSKESSAKFGWRKYSKNSVIHLINFIRDQDAHRLNWKSTALESEEIFDVDGTKYESYFMRTFPELPTLLYVILQDTKLQGNETNRYYKNNPGSIFTLDS